MWFTPRQRRQRCDQYQTGRLGCLKWSDSKPVDSQRKPQLRGSTSPLPSGSGYLDKGEDMNEQNSAQERLTDVEERLTRVENLLVSINEKLDQRSNVGKVDTEKAEEFKEWGDQLRLNAITATRAGDMRSSR